MQAIHSWELVPLLHRTTEDERKRKKAPSYSGRGGGGAAAEEKVFKFRPTVGEERGGVVQRERGNSGSKRGGGT